MPQRQPCSTCNDRGWIITPLTESERTRRSARLTHVLGIDLEAVGLVGLIIECPDRCDATEYRDREDATVAA